MTVEDTVRKANTVLDVIIEYDEKNIDCGFKQLLEEIIKRWKSENVNSYPNSDFQREIPTNPPKTNKTEVFIS